MLLSEKNIIHILTKNLKKSAFNLSFLDDAAVIPNSSMSIVTSCDMLVENIDFTSKHFSPKDIAHKALASSLSDMAAMGALPIGFLQSLALPHTISKTWLIEYAKGQKVLSQKYRCPLLGGDLSSTFGPITINITVFGTYQKSSKNKFLKRQSAKPGDILCVGGFLGDACAGLEILQKYPHLKNKFKKLINAQKKPKPQIELGQFLLGSHHCTSAMDLSDGLAGDIVKLLPKKLGSIMSSETLPVSSELKKYARFIKKNPYQYALIGGEDFVLLFTIDKLHIDKVLTQAERKNLSIYKIGIVNNSGQCIFVDNNNQPINPKNGFKHFN